MHENKAKSTGAIIKGIVKKYHLENDLLDRNIFDSWVEIVGPELANICEPVKLDNGKLTLKVKTQIWRQELGNRQKELLNSIKTKTKEIKINSIDFI
jgi:predicted nucleic acid-binding Zn ribbon protein